MVDKKLGPKKHTRQAAESLQMLAHVLCRWMGWDGWMDRRISCSHPLCEQWVSSSVSSSAKRIFKPVAPDPDPGSLAGLAATIGGIRRDRVLVCSATILGLEWIILALSRLATLALFQATTN